MKLLKYVLFGMLALMITSCGTTTRFHVSEVVPAADITVKRKQDKNDNYKIKITAQNLASPERLNPPKSSYVAWVITHDGYKNIGQLNINNAKKAKLNTLTPHTFSEMLITAEDSGTVVNPTGPYITYTIFVR